MNKLIIASLTIAVILTNPLFSAAKNKSKLAGHSFNFEELETGDAIMKMVEKRFAANSEIEVIKMTTTDRNGNVKQGRFLSIIQRDPAGDYSYLIRFLDPVDIKGVTLVTREQGAGEAEQFLYLPAMGQIKPIRGSGKSGYFMGTDFTFEDLRKENSMEYSFTRQFDDKHDRKDCFVILSAPADYQKMQAKGFSSRMIFVEKGSYKILKIEYYNENQDLLKVFEAYDYNSTKVDGPSERPHRAIMKNMNTQSVTVMTLEKSRLNYDVDPNLFTKEAMQAWTPEWTRMYLDVFQQKQGQ